MSFSKYGESYTHLLSILTVTFNKKYVALTVYPAGNVHIEEEKPTDCVTLKPQTSLSWGSWGCLYRNILFLLRWLITFKMVIYIKEFNNLWWNWHVLSCYLISFKYHKKRSPWEQLTCSTTSIITTAYCTKLICVLISSIISEHFVQLLVWQ